MEQQLSRIERSKEFAGSGQLRRLLRFLVQVSGNGETANQYRIATEIFGRSQSFDPASDPIVRVEMRRLRGRLAEYYRKHPNEPWIIQVPHHSYAAVTTRAPRAGTQVPRVAVLPFLSRSDDETCGILSEGLADDLIYVLRPDPDLVVLARTSVFSLNSLGLSPAEIAERVGAEWVVEGWVAKREGAFVAGATLRGAVQGMEARWTREWVCGPDEIPGLAELIAAEVRGSVVRQKGKGMAIPGTHLPTHGPGARAHQLCLQGQQLLAKRRPDTVLRAIDCFERSIQEGEPTLRPRIGLLEATMVRAFAGLEVTGEEPRARQLLEECREREPNSADALTGSAMFEMCFTADWPAGLEYLRRAVEVEPHNVLPYSYYPLCLCLAGRLEEGFEVIRKGLRLDPLSPILHSRFGSMALHCGRAEEAIEAFEDAIEDNPTFPLNYFQLATALASLGRTEAALRRIEEAEAMAATSPFVMAMKGYVLARAGDAAGARAVADRLELLTEKGLVSPMAPAFVYVGMSEIPRAADMVRLAVERRSYFLLTYLAAAGMEPLREWAGLQEILRPIGPSRPFMPISREAQAMGAPAPGTGR